MAETSVTAASTDGPAELPRVELDVSMPAVTGRTIYVAAGGNLFEDVLDSAVMATDGGGYLTMRFTAPGAMNYFNLRFAPAID